MSLGPPIAPDAYTERRWEESRRRVRMLSGMWVEDLKRAAINLAGEMRAASWGDADTTKNVARSIVQQLSILYDRAPLILHDSEPARQTLEDALTDAGAWQLAAQLQRYTVGCREAVMRLDVPDAERGELQVRVVTPDRVTADASPDAPDVPIKLCEWRVREVEGTAQWTVDYMDVSDLNAPVYQVQSTNGEDITAKVSGVEPGWPDLWRYDNGEPFIPGVLYHAQRTGELWDPWTGKELFDGALRVGVLLSYWGHLVRSASWPQRYAVNARVPGLRPTTDDTRPGPQWIATDPSTLLMLVADRPDTTVQLGQWEAGGDPELVLGAIRDYAADLAIDFDISPADIQRASGDARSGYAIALTREGQRSAQRRYEPQFARGDREMLRKAAALLNRAGAASLPETGWDIEYQGVPLSLDERRLFAEDVQRQLDLGLISRVQAYAMLHGITEGRARERLAQIDDDRRRYPAG